MANPPIFSDSSAFGEGPQIPTPPRGIAAGTPADLANAFVHLVVADPNNLTPDGHKGGYMRVSDLVAYIVATAKEP